MQVPERLLPGDVRVVDLAQHRLRALVNSVEVGRDVQQDPLFPWDHHFHVGAAQVDFQRPGPRGHGGHPLAQLEADDPGEQIGFARIV